LSASSKALGLSHRSLDGLDGQRSVVAHQGGDPLGLITPVPGGLGPMTIALLLEQTVDAAFLRLDTMS
jgi:hypothetical protein